MVFQHSYVPRMKLARRFFTELWQYLDFLGGQNAANPVYY